MCVHFCYTPNNITSELFCTKKITTSFKTVNYTLCIQSMVSLQFYLLLLPHKAFE